MTQNLDQISNLIVKILKTDRWVFTICDGEMGEGKSCFTTQLAVKVAKKIGTKFTYKDNMTYSRLELKKWIDGDEKGKGQKPEYSVVLSDEIISMFFKRNWYDSEQIDGIELLNKCRDRHLCVIGNIPSFWDLDSAMYPLITFWVHIHKRGVAWLFQKDRNPFTRDPWHRRVNEKVFKKYGYPYKCNGFVTDIPFPDWQPKDKQDYYRIRNTKRVNTEGQRKKYVQEKYRNIKQQRDNSIRLLFDKVENLKTKHVADIIGLSDRHIENIKIGVT